MAGCALKDCLKKFTAAEQVENYRCTHCWHIAAVKYISIGGNEATVQKIESCTKEDSCDCERLVHLETIPWSNRFSRTLKQISIARCPKIFCIHLKRVSVNVFGELVKLQGHISFPLILDLSSYMISGVETNCWEKNWKTGRVQLQSGNLSPNPNPFNLEYDPRRLNFVQGLARGCTYQEGLASDASQFTENALDSSPEFPSEGSFSETTQPGTEQMNRSFESVPQDTCSLYRLVAVVEHFGRAGSGHYTVYRSVKADLCCEQQPGDHIDASTTCWFSISDAEVCSVSTEHVLCAEASMLFYERYRD